jgi:hypothetical protein
MKNQITRRQLAGTLLATAAAAQAPPEAPPSTPAAELQAARDQNQRTAETLAKAPVPMDSEPAFHFTV